jgi:hypothetical protein
MFHAYFVVVYLPDPKPNCPAQQVPCVIEQVFFLALWHVVGLNFNLKIQRRN